MSSQVPIPTQDPIAKTKRLRGGPGSVRSLQDVIRFISQPDDQEGTVGDKWIDYFTANAAAIDAAPSRQNSITLTDQSASIAATDMSGGSLAAGLYLITWYVRISQASGGTSSLTVAFDWADRSTTITTSGAAVTGNAVNTFSSGSFGTVMIRVDANSPVRYATTYASTGVPVMKYDFISVLQRIAV